MHSLYLFYSNPVAFSFFGFTIHWKGIITMTAVFAGILYCIHAGKKNWIGKKQIFELFFIGLPLSIVTARIYYIIFNWGYYKYNLIEIPMLWEGGIAIHGGLIGAFLFLFMYAHNMGFSFWRLADTIAPGLLLGQSLGRWANLITQEAYGEAVNLSFLYSLRLPDFIIDRLFIYGSYRHPTFLYSSLWNFIGFLLLLLLNDKYLKKGEVFLVYLLWNSLGRFWIEIYRADSLMMEDLKIAQAFTFLVTCICLITFPYRRIKGTADRHPLS
ncbi:prolipoprotein diacylglyceryl transferase [Fictibacillus fluitans]|uniref:Phosphatidylglycerol--prolipoprotein diacylglyceryl transferase n=1 Tax=Fictibacillus fluitans TaxID=3058422 RepID=A0ABT8HRE7_9BACL|nr:prolipoprotein diacylglyceryl transferase [Fictibacillus sp. NE201]MDN4523330.1 prolipoprotein diacylglyceryl transferase [Fictibacillus sp. NE201]